MILVKYNLASPVWMSAKTAFSFITVMLLSIQLAGCSDSVSLPSELELAQFEKNGPDLPAMGMHRMLTARMHEAPLPGEVLEITMPLILQIVTTDEPSTIEADAPYLSRVSETGTITLPAVGEIEVAGKTLAQIESSIINAYYPEFTHTRPSVFVRLAEEQGLAQPLFTVLGLVNRPGNFPYPPSVRYNIMQALGFAGGLDRATDPRFATIYRLTPGGTVIGQNFAIAGDQDNTNLTPALSTLVKPGDIVVVEHTPRTHTKEFLDRTFRLNFGTYWSLRAPWED